MPVARTLVAGLQGQPSALARGYAARVRGLMADGARAERHLRAAVDLTGSGVHAFEAARSRLTLGQWLRRRRRRAEAVGS